jgi:hypothetical protein
LRLRKDGGRARQSHNTGRCWSSLLFEFVGVAKRIDRSSLKKRKKILDLPKKPSAAAR